MAQLPGVSDLGATPQVSVYRPASVGGYDTSGIAAGGQALARGAEQLGRGVEQAGADLGAIAQNDARVQATQAHSGALAEMITARAGAAQDPNFGPDASGKRLPDRFADQVLGIRDKWAATITDPRAREAFTSALAPHVAEQNAWATEHYRSLASSDIKAKTLTSGNTLINSGAGADEATHTALMDSHNQAIEALKQQGTLTPLEAYQWRKDFVSKYQHADVAARVDRGDAQGALDDLRTSRAAAAGDPAAGNAYITNRILQIEGTDKNGRSSATGAGQFIDSTWLDMIKKNRPDLAQGRSDTDILALRSDRGLGRDMTEAYRAQNEASLKAAGIAATPGNQYLAHFLGPAGAKAVLQADPKMPIADALAKAVGPDKAAAMTAANPTVLQGQLVGSVTAWADSKMGGGGHRYEALDAGERDQLINYAEQGVHKQGVESRAQFLAQQQDAEAEALNTGAPSKPLSQAQFIAEYGAAEGPFRFQEYDAKVHAGATRASFAQMTPEQRQTATDSLAPQPGEANYAVKQRNHEIAQREDDAINRHLREAPADFAIQRSPAAKDAWANLQAARSGENTMMTPEAAASNYAAVTVAEQRRAGAREPQILPKSEAESLAAQLRNPDAAGGPGAVLGHIESASKLWGDNWPQVYREIAPKLDPTLRVVAAGVDPTAGKLLIANHAVDEAKILGTQYEEKKAPLDRAVTDAMRLIGHTFVGSEEDETRRDYLGVARKLAAIYISHGTLESVAATQAVREIIGSKYDIKGDYRVPHDAGVSADQVAAGVAAARASIDKLDLATEKDNVGGLRPAYLQAATASTLAREGKWVTSPDERGLMLTYGSEFWTRASDPQKPFMLTWQELRDLGVSNPQAGRTTPAARAHGALRDLTRDTSGENPI